MKSKIMYFAVFVAGVVIGSASTMQYFKIKYEKIADEEIKSVKETLLSKIENTTDDEDISEEDEDISEEDEYISEEDLEEYEEIVKDYALISKEDKEEKMKKKPYVIPPEEFGEEDDYELNTLIYYANGVLTNELDEVIEGKELEALVGKDSLTHFGEYEDDSVYVRNDKLKTYFEILRDNEEYYDEEQ